MINSKLRRCRIQNLQVNTNTDTGLLTLSHWFKLILATAATPSTFFKPELIEGAESFSSKSLNIRLRIGEPAHRRAEWIMLFFKAWTV
jgi:hypothetical protein